MNDPRRADHRAATAAMLTAAAMIAQQVAGKATRDGFFLSNFPVTQLPGMLVLAGLLSAALALGWGRMLRRHGPHVAIPAAFGASAALYLATWLVALANPRTGAFVTYLLVAVLGPVLISGFWSLVNERFDPRAAKRSFGRIAGMGTLGGVVGGVVADRVGAAYGIAAMLPVLGGIHVVCALCASRVHMPEDLGSSSRRIAVADAADGPFTGLRLLANTPYLQKLAAVVLLGTVTAALLDYVFKSSATSAVQGEAGLVRLFSVFHTAMALLAFLVQAALSRPLLEGAGLARTASGLPLAVAAGSAMALAVPGLATAIVARGLEYVARNSVFRSAYELLFTPLPEREKRGTKTMIDVGFDRLGDAVGGGLAAALLLLVGAGAPTAMLWTCFALGAFGVWLALGLHRDYVSTLERSLLDGAIGLEGAEDATTRAVAQRAESMRFPASVMTSAPGAATTSSPSLREDLLTQRIDLSQLGLPRREADAAAGRGPHPTPAAGEAARPAGSPPAREPAFPTGRVAVPPPPPTGRIAVPPSGPIPVPPSGRIPIPPSGPIPVPPSGSIPISDSRLLAGLEPRARSTVERAAALLSGDAARARHALTEPLSAALVPYVFPLLGKEAVAADAMRALRAIAPNVVGQITDALLDATIPVTARRRLARLLGVLGTGRAADALFRGLDDPRFDIRHACGAALARIRAATPDATFSRDRVFNAVHREVDVERGVWAAQRAIERLDDDSEASPLVDAYLRQRASASLEHVFNLLALVLPHRPLRVAFQGLHSEDRMLRGTALEYLESVLPAPVRDRLWPFLEADASRPPTQRGRGEIMNDMMRSHDSIRIKISELREQGEGAGS